MEHPESMQQVIDRLNDRRGLPPKEPKQKGQTLLFRDPKANYFPVHHQAKIADRWVFKAENLDDLAKIEHIKAVIGNYTLDELKERLP